MAYQAGAGCEISETAVIADGVSLGRYNQIGSHVVIAGFKGHESVDIQIGDCNTIAEHTRILIGKGGLRVGGWNTFHNHVTVLGEARIEIGHNGWFGQYVMLDGTGGLTIGNGVTLGMYSRVWSHVARGELIEGCTLFRARPTIIEDDVWVVGSCSVASGVRLAYRSVILGTTATGNTEPKAVYADAPRQRLEKRYWRDISGQEKLSMMRQWAEGFVAGSDNVRITKTCSDGFVISAADGEALVVTLDSTRTVIEGQDRTVFDLTRKQYTKRLGPLERAFYQYLKDYKARFLPIDGARVETAAVNESA